MYIRRRYKFFLEENINVLNGKCSPEDIYVRSTDSDRTLMSAQCKLAGFCSPVSGLEIWKSGFNWQPFPIHTVQPKNDFILSNKAICQRRDFLVNKRSTELIQQNRSFVDYLQLKSGHDYMNRDRIMLLRDTLYIKKLKNLKLVNFHLHIV